jgi:hypothetical protein
LRNVSNGNGGEVSNSAQAGSKSSVGLSVSPELSMPTGSSGSLTGPPDHYLFPSERYGLHGSKGTFGGVVKVYDFHPETPIAGWKSSWTTCRTVAKVECRWHDMRHTFISRMGENRVADQTLLALTGQLSRKMLERYSHSRKNRNGPR